MFDVARWVQGSPHQGWDVEQLMLTGVNAGASLRRGHRAAMAVRLVTDEAEGAAAGAQERGSTPKSDVVIASSRAVRRSTWWTASAGSDS